MQKNDEFISSAIGYGTEGECIFTFDEAAVFVPYAICGEECKVKILSAKGGAAYGKLISVITPSAHRVSAPCPVFGKCGGCQLQHMDYAEQLNFKRQLVANSLKKIGGILHEVLPVKGSQKIYGYRNKLVLPIGRQDGKDVIGFYAPRSHRIVEVETCAIQSDWCGGVIKAVKKYMTAQNLHGYDELSKKGELRRIAVREADGKYIVALVASKPVNAQPLAQLLERELGKDFTLLLNINSSSGNAIFGKDWRILRGDGFFEATDCGIKYRAGANTFLQVNEGVRKELYAHITREAQDGGAVAIDLYSGGGMLTAMLAKACKSAYGIEVVPEASACADELKDMNGLQDKMINICGKVEEELERVLKETQGDKRVLICDPPRKGMERVAVKAMLQSKAEKIILVSCNAATLARDLGLLVGTLCEDGGALKKNTQCGESGAYRIKYIQPYDMFPQTKHVETLVCLERV